MTKYLKAFNHAVNDRDFNKFREEIWGSLNSKAKERFSLEQTFMANEMMHSQTLAKEETTNPKMLKKVMTDDDDLDDDKNESKENFKKAYENESKKNYDDSLKVRHKKDAIANFTSTEKR